MKRSLCLAAISLKLLLAACQSAPVPIGTPLPTAPAGDTAAGDTAAGDTAAGDTAAGDTAAGDVIGFFKDDPQRSLTIEVPQGWVAKLGSEDARAPIVVTDDWGKYQNKALNKEALGVIVSPLTDKGSPEQILATVAGRLGEMLTERQGEITTSAQGDHQIAWVEYSGKSVDDGTPVQYLLAVVVKDQRSVFAFTSVLPDRVESVRPKFQEVVNGITLR
jgi:hypothetical protein